ncbi:hypothetical protein, partial [Klebsiella pneumoniae]
SSKLNLATIGCDINPSACKISNIYKLSNLEYCNRKVIVDKFSSLLEPVLQEITDENIFEYSKKIIDLIDLKDDFLKIMVEGYLILSDVHPH